MIIDINNFTNVTQEMLGFRHEIKPKINFNLLFTTEPIIAIHNVSMMYVSIQGMTLLF